MINIKNGLVLYGSSLEPVKANVQIDGDLIVEVSPHASGGREVDATGCIVAPSLINSHVHLGDSLAKDIGDDKPISEVVKPPNGLKHRILRESDPESITRSMRNSLEEMLLTGTTTMIDFREGGIEGILMADKASEDIPIRRIVLGRHDSFLDHSIDPHILEESAEEILKKAEGIGLSGFGEINDSNASRIVRRCKKNDKLSAIHVAEYEEVQKKSLASTGKTEVQRALDAGFDLLVHLTNPHDSDLDKVREKGVSVVSCPRSNGTLSVGIPPLLDMQNKGINILLGTDNLMFNSPNMFREMEYALKVTRGYYKEYFPPVEILKMATVNAGQALNLNLGSIDEGKLADIMIVEQLSVDPILSLINRTESKNIIGLITDGNIVYLR